LRLLIGSSRTYYHHFKEFGKELSKNGIEYKIEKDEYLQPFGRNIGKYFAAKKKYKKLIKDYNPDFVLVDVQTLFARTAVEVGKPLVIFLRGNFWEEMELAKKTLFRSPTKKHIFRFFLKMATKCFEESVCIIPVSTYLEKIVKSRYPNKPTCVIHPGLNTNLWYPQEGMNLKHPCVGLVQAANIWGKTQEMLILPKVLEAMPDVTFYWAGDGPYRDKILPQLEKYTNFKWLGSLEYPDKVRQFLTEIDVYALISGLDMTPVSLLEAQLMKKPVVASNVGGVSETMRDTETGFLVAQGDYQDWIGKLGMLIEDEKKRSELGILGSEFVKENFSWEKNIDIFLSIVKTSGIN